MPLAGLRRDSRKILIFGRKKSAPLIFNVDELKWRPFHNITGIFYKFYFILILTEVS